MPKNGIKNNESGIMLKKHYPLLAKQVASSAYSFFIIHSSSQRGITSLSALIIVLLIVILGWQASKYIEDYLGFNIQVTKTEDKYNPDCEGADDICNPDEGAGELPPPYTPPVENEIFSWEDDGKP